MRVHAQGPDRLAAIAAMDNYQTMGKKLFSDAIKLDVFMTMLADFVYDRLNVLQDGQAQSP